MRTWVKVSLGVVAAGILAFVALAGTGAYFFVRHLETRHTSEASARPEFEEIRARFKGRPPLIEVTNPSNGDVRVLRVKHPEGKRANTIHVLSWSGGDDQLLSTDIPLWLMRFSSVNILSHLGVAPDRYR